MEINLAGHNNVPLCSDVCSYLVKQLATTRRNSTSSDQVNATLHQVATEQNDTIILLNIEWKEMRPMHQIHNCKLISHMLNPHWRNVCACYNNKISIIRKCQCYNELCSFGETISLHMIDLIWFYNHSLRIRTRDWFSPKVISTPCAKKKRYAKGQKLV